MSRKAQMLSKAIALASEKFTGKLDKGGRPYILHCIHVMHNVKKNDDELKCIAVLHDVIEDTDVTADDLRALGMSDRVIDGVLAMTHEDGESYEDYIKKLSSNIDSVIVKKEDLRHNSDITRIKGLRDKDIARIEKYHRAYTHLCVVEQNYFFGG